MGWNHNGAKMSYKNEICLDVDTAVFSLHAVDTF